MADYSRKQGERLRARATPSTTTGAGRSLAMAKKSRRRALLEAYGRPAPTGKTARIPERRSHPRLSPTSE